jgi:hypothetical protein
MAFAGPGFSQPPTARTVPSSDRDTLWPNLSWMESPWIVWPNGVQAVSLNSNARTAPFMKRLHRDEGRQEDEDKNIQSWICSERDGYFFP